LELESSDLEPGEGAPEKKFLKGMQKLERTKKIGQCPNPSNGVHWEGEKKRGGKNFRREPISFKDGQDTLSIPRRGPAHRGKVVIAVQGGTRLLEGT